MMRGRTGGQQVQGGPSASAAGRVVRWSARLLGLALLVLLVACIATGIRTPEPEARDYSASEQAQLDAEGRFRALAADARAAASADPASAERLTAIASDLDVQAAAVALPRSPDATDATGRTDTGRTPGGASVAVALGGPASSPGSGAASAGAPDELPTGGPAMPPVDGARVLALLRESSLRSLRDAVGADPGAARVLAASGVNQWRHAVQLGQVLGVEAGLPSADALPTAGLVTGTGLFADPAAGGVGGVGAQDGATADAPYECVGTPRGPDADRQALLNAASAEDRARYGYEVAAALLPDPDRALSRSAAHRAAGAAAAGHLVRLCVEPGPARAGYSIAPAFRADPAAALRELEQDHAALYAGLVPTVGPDVRAWAIASYNAAAQRSLDDGTPLDALPALQAGAAGTTDDGPAPATTGGVPVPTEQADE